MCHRRPLVWSYSLSGRGTPEWRERIRILHVLEVVCVFRNSFHDKRSSAFRSIVSDLDDI